MQENERVDAEIARRTFNTFNLRAPPLTLEALCEVLRPLLAGLHFLLSILRFPCCKRSENQNASARASKLIADYAGLGDEQRQHFSAYCNDGGRRATTILSLFTSHRCCKNFAFCLRLHLGRAIRTVAGASNSRPVFMVLVARSLGELFLLQL